MNLYITFYRKTDRRMYVDNGFSFFEREKNQDDIDLYFNYEKPTSLLKKEIAKHPSPDAVFCSLSFSEHLELIRPLVTDKWVLGGPLVSNLVTRGADLDLPGKAIAGFYEKHQGKARLSCQFDPYFKDWVRTQETSWVVFNCSIGKGCYWNKCKFCEYRYFDSKGETDAKISVRPNIKDIVEQLRPLPGVALTQAHLCTPAVTPKALKQILEAKRDKKVRLTIFVRADDIILDVLKEFNDPGVCENIVLNCGCESLSQYALDRLNKGTTVKNTIELTKLILERGGKASLGIMDHYPFANRQMASETLDALKKLTAIASKYPKTKTLFCNNGQTRWPTEQAVCEFTDDYYHWYEHGYKLYCSKIAKNSDAFEYNKQISLAVKNSGILTLGQPFESLK